MAKADLTAQRLRELLSYDPETGVFRWLVRISQSVKPGRIAGGIATYGHRQITIFGRRHMAHRLAWLYVHGAWPEFDLDHRDGIGDHNWITNLREAPGGINQQNRRRPSSTATSGFLGVTWNRSARKWQAQIRDNGRCHYIGIFDSPELAHEAYVLKKRAIHPGCTL